MPPAPIRRSFSSGKAASLPSVVIWKTTKEGKCLALVAVKNAQAVVPSGGGPGTGFPGKGRALHASEGKETLHLTAAVMTFSPPPSQQCHIFVAGLHLEAKILNTDYRSDTL